MRRPEAANRGRALFDTMLSGAVLTVHEQYQGNERQFDVQLAQHPLKLGRTAQGGIHGPNDLVLEVPFAARDQARIEPEGLGHRLVHLGAPNRLTIRDQPQEDQPYLLHDGDVLELRHATSSAVVTLTYKNPLLKMAEQAPAIKNHQLDPKQLRTAIGRQGCAVLLQHPTVSRVHAWVDRLPDGSHILRDAGSSNGTFVNGQRVSQHSLNAGDIIQIGPFKLVYQTNRLDQYDQRRGMRIDVRDLTHTVTANGQQKKILASVSLSIEAREFVAIVGGSGAGKTTLMRAMSGYARAQGGQVLVNGDDFYQHFDAYRALMGYVPQDDILHQTLQVDRALDYAARLRLSADSDAAERSQRVERALRDVEMLPHRAKQVDALSGGQRKRVSIAAELLADPSLFFLDEPTSGLDPGLEKKMMHTLRQLADGGRTVVLVTHATENIALCDHVVFMAGGRMVFFGPPADALSFFGVASGLFSDIYTRLEGSADESDPLVQANLAREYAGWRQQHPQQAEPPTLAELWELKYRGSAIHQRYVASRLASSSPMPVKNTTPAHRPRVARQSPLRQLALLTRRYVELTIRDRWNLLILLLQAPIIGLMNLLLIRSDVVTGATAEGLIPRLQAQSLLFVLAPISVWFGVINAAREITKEQAIYRRERLSNLALLPYVFSKVMVLSILVLIQNAALLGILALKVDFAGLMGAMFLQVPELYISMVLASLAGMALGLIISALCTTSDQAISMVPLALVPQIVFTGLVFRLEPDSLSEAISRLMISRWAVDALGTSVNINQFCDLPNGSPLAANCAPALADLFPDAFIRSPEHLRYTWLILLLFVGAGVAITALLLKLKDRRS
ncbi:MAG: ATP-binding cassette domain-containing protein [Kouleothrix sp.]|nr:ATP-binding cassette domain-containing protein [Kouleothrix sp.]